MNVIDQKKIDAAKGPLAKAEALLAQLEGEGLTWNVGGFTLRIRFEREEMDVDVRLTLFGRVLFDEILNATMLESLGASILSLILHGHSPILGGALESTFNAVRLVAGGEIEADPLPNVREIARAEAEAAQRINAQRDAANEAAKIAVAKAEEQDPEAAKRANDAALAAARKLVAEADAKAEAAKAAETAGAERA